ncbi:MAG: HAD family hydrolase [Planctomycetes bacterium]|nr:HAD family hydrolase [Planctomycetota bacterium]
MTINAMIFDLDDTLLVEVASAEAAFLATCELARHKYGLDPAVLHTTLRREAKALWYASPERPIIERISVSHWEGLWARFEGDAPDITRLRQWAVYYRQSSWKRALAAFDIEDAPFATELSLEFRRQRETRHVLFDDTLPILEALHGRVKLGLVTNGLSCLQHEKIAGSGLSHFFDAMLVAGDIGVAKPAPIVFHTLLGQLDVTPDETLMVGNSVTSDIGGAQGVGMKAVLIHRGEIHGADDRIQPDVVIENLMSIMDCL